MPEIEKFKIRKISDGLRRLKKHQENYLDVYGNINVLGFNDPKFSLPREGYIGRTFKDLYQIDQERQQGESEEQQFAGFKAAAIGDKDLVGILRRRGARVLLTGPGGSGKSEFSKHVAHVFAKEMLTDPSKLLVPVRIELRDLTYLGQSIPPKVRWRPLVEAFCQLSDNLNKKLNGRTLFKKLAKRGELVLILDGLDELRIKADEFTQQLVAAFTTIGAPFLDCSLLLLGRDEGVHSDLKRIVKQKYQYMPQALSNDEINTYIRRYFQLPRGNPVQGEKLITAIHISNSGIGELLVSPFMLALTCVRFRRGKIQLPESPAVLMNIAITELLAQRFKDRENKPRYRKIERALDKLSMLAAASLIRGQQDNRCAYVLNHDDAAKCIKEGSWLRELARKSGIFTLNLIDGTYEFTNRTLAEYLAGRGIAFFQNSDFIHDYYLKNVWKRDWERPLFWVVGTLALVDARLSDAAQKRELPIRLAEFLFDAINRGEDDVAEVLFQRSCACIAAVPLSVKLPSKLVASLISHLTPTEANAISLSYLVPAWRTLPMTYKCKPLLEWVRLLSHGSFSIHRVAMIVLGTQSVNMETIESLVGLLFHPVQFVRSQAAYALKIQRLDTRSIERITSILFENRSRSQWIASQALDCQLLNSDSICKLATLLTDKLKHVRVNAAIALRNQNLDTGMLRKVNQVLAGDNSMTMSIEGERMFESQYLGDEIISELMMFLTDNRDYVRAHASDALSRQKLSEESIDRLLALLHDVDVEDSVPKCIVNRQPFKFVRFSELPKERQDHEAFMVQELLKSQRVYARIIERFVPNDDTNAAKNALLSELQIQEHDAIELAATLMMDGRPGIQWIGGSLLASQQLSANCARQLRGFLSKWKTCNAAAFVLRSQRLNAKAVERLMMLLRNEHWYVRRTAAISLIGQNLNDNALERVRKLMADPNEDVRLKAEEILVPFSLTRSNLAAQLLSTDSSRFFANVGMAAETLVFKGRIDKLKDRFASFGLEPAPIPHDSPNGVVIVPRDKISLGETSSQKSFVTRTSKTPAGMEEHAKLLNARMREFHNALFDTGSSPF